MNPAPPPPAQPKGPNVALIVVAILVVAFCGCGVLGIVAGIAVPNFVKFQARSKQSDCRTNLKSLYTSERMYQAEHDAFSNDVVKLGFSPERSRYTYFLGDGATVPPSAPGVAAATERDLPPLQGGEPEVGDKAFVAVCAGNVDNDSLLDVWSISSEERVINGQKVAPGEPFNEQNDVALP
jgi:type IV pilus assembly protein PilA